MKGERVSFRAEEGLSDRVEGIASECTLSKSDVLRFALEHGLSSLEGDIAAYPEYNTEAITKAIWLGIDISEIDSIRRV